MCKINVKMSKKMKIVKQKNIGCFLWYEMRKEIYKAHNHNFSECISILPVAVETDSFKTGF